VTEEQDTHAVMHKTGNGERRVKMKSKILAGLVIMLVLLVTIAQPALAYTYPDSPETDDSGGGGTWALPAAVSIPVMIVIHFVVQRVFFKK
jgi:uncharacterized membrane protein